MLAPSSRQERFRSLLNSFLNGTDNSVLKVHFYPSELIRFKKEFPKLNFNVIRTVKTSSSKKHEVDITKI